jgi:hypothetical protein
MTMAKKKEPPKPLFAVKHDFVAALESVCNEAGMLLNALETVLKHDGNLKPGVRDLLAERCKALRAALYTADDQ